MVSTGVGFLAVAVAIVCFGSNYVPVKTFNMGDGMFFQLIMCMGIWLVGLIVYIARSAPPFEAFAMLGGALWSTGNVSVVPIVSCIGMGLGVLIWGAGNLVVGWSMGYFGWFGLDKDEPAQIPELNVVGFFVALGSMAWFFFVDTEVQSSGAKNSARSGAAGESPEAHLLGGDHQPQTSGADVSSDVQFADAGRKKGFGSTADRSSVDPEGVAAGAVDASLGRPRSESAEVEASRIRWIQAMTPYQRKLFGYITALAAGVLYATNFVPPLQLMQQEGKSEEGLDYVFPHFCGIFVTSLIYFIIYALYKRNVPFINPRSVLPSLVCGMLWGVAQTAWFVANQALAVTTSFPLITTGPGVVASLWGVFYFREIRGKRNFFFLAMAFFFVFAGVGLITGSKLG